MITVLERPQGHVLEELENAATVSDSAGDALFTDVGHGLTDTDYVYVISEAESYNGFWLVDSISADTFKLRKYDGAAYVQFKKAITVTWIKSLLAHGWSCAHLPITYKLRSDLYPANESDTTRLILGVSEDNGLTRISLSGSLGTFDELMFVEITDSNADGIYQILEKYSTTDITISLAYVSTLDMVGAQIVLYYQSYHIKVNLYANNQLALQLTFIPDANNEVFFSVNEVLKGYLNIRNNLLLDDLPLNSDFSVPFYIETIESYDTSDGYTITTFDDDPEIDDFIGHAVNSILDFKNRYSGYMSRYLFAQPEFYGDAQLARWLSKSTKIFPDHFFDLSFIKNAEGEFRIDTYVDSVLVNQEVVADKGLGVYRVEAAAGGAEVCIEIWRTQQTIDPPAEPGIAAFNAATQSGTGETWTQEPAPLRWQMILAALQSSRLLLFEITDGLADVEYSIGYDFTVTAATSVPIRLYNETLTQSITSTVIMGSSGNFTGTRNLTPGFLPKYLSFSVPSGGLAGVTVDVEPFTWAVDTGDPVNVPEAQMTERYCLEVDNECHEDSIYLTWLNNLGGFDYFLFTAEKDYLKDIVDVTERTKNIFPGWPNSYGENADTVRQDTSRISREQIVIRSGYMSLADLLSVTFIKESILVQIVNSRNDRRTILIDRDSFTVYTDDDELYQIQFIATYTNDNPSQKL